MDKEREIRAILSGRTNYRNGAYVAADGLFHMNFQGVNNGSLSVSLFGVNHLVRYYQAKDPNAAVDQALKIFSVLGHPVLFSESPEEMACLVRPPFGNPSVMTLEQIKDGMVLNVYTARTLLSALSRHRAITAFENRLPAELRDDFDTRNERQTEPKENRKTRKARRKAKKWEKRVARAEKKTEKVKQEAKSAQEQAEEQEP